MTILAAGELPRPSPPFAHLPDKGLSLLSSMCDNSLGIFVENKLKRSRQRNVVSTKHIYLRLRMQVWYWVEGGDFSLWSFLARLLVQFSVNMGAAGDSLSHIHRENTFREEDQRKWKWEHKGQPLRHGLGKAVVMGEKDVGYPTSKW